MAVAVRGGAVPGVIMHTGHVIGHWRTDLPPAGEAGIRPYIYVTRLDDVLRKAAEQGAEVVTQPYPEGSLTIATVRDPAGNVIGIWQESTCATTTAAATTS